MVSTGKKARRTFGTRADAKRSKGTKGKVFMTPDVKVKDYPTGEKAIAVARRMGLPAPVNISKRPPWARDE